MHLVIFSICLNEDKTIGELLDRMPTKIKGIDKITKIVIDDGSEDKTAQIAKEHGAIVISNYSQKKLAYSFQVAVDKALEIGADMAVNIDGDLQFMPEEIPELVKPIVDNKADFVAADRFHQKGKRIRIKPENMPPAKYYGNIIGTYILSKLAKKQFSDVTCGFRAYSRNTLMNLNILSSFTYTQESFQILALKNFRITQIPVSIKYYPGRKSRVVTSIINYLVTSATNIIRTFRDNAPLRFFGIIGIFFSILSVLAGFIPLYRIIETGTITPYKYLGLISIFLFSVSILFLLFGLLADIFTRVIANQERIIVLLKESKYSKQKK
ncbi:MAG: glycosyltransferase family 2 protein [bacterium]